jgi:hypothetical protein
VDGNIFNTKASTSRRSAVLLFSVLGVRSSTIFGASTYTNCPESLSGTSRARALPESIWTRRGTSCFPPPDLLLVRFGREGCLALATAENESSGPVDRIRQSVLRR